MINQLIGGDVSKCSGSAAAVRGLPWQADVQSWQLSQELHPFQRQLKVESKLNIVCLFVCLFFLFCCNLLALRELH